MSKIYEVNLSTKGIQELINKVQKMKKALNSQEFLEYIEQKAFETLQKITLANLNTTNQDTSEYYKNHQHTIKGDEIWLWNETLVDLSYLGKETKSRYSNGLSLAKIVEYGTGIPGEQSNQGQAEDWKYQVNTNRDYSKGWIYKDSTGYHFSRGVEAKLIFYKTKKEIENNLQKWVSDYIEKKLG